MTKTTKTTNGRNVGCETHGTTAESLAYCVTCIGCGDDTASGDATWTDREPDGWMCPDCVPEYCDSCGDDDAGDSLPFRLWHAEGMLLVLCDDCAAITGHRAGSRHCCRGYVSSDR